MENFYRELHTNEGSFVTKCGRQRGPQRPCFPLKPPPWSQDVWGRVVFQNELATNMISHWFQVKLYKLFQVSNGASNKLFHIVSLQHSMCGSTLNRLRSRSCTGAGLSVLQDMSEIRSWNRKPEVQISATSIMITMYIVLWCFMCCHCCHSTTRTMSWGLWQQWQHRQHPEPEPTTTRLPTKNKQQPTVKTRDIQKQQPHVWSWWFRVFYWW